MSPSYADVIHMYITLSQSEPVMALSKLQDYLLDVGDWMGSSKLMVNPDKTEDLLFGIKLHQKERMKYFPTKLLHHKITPTDSARSLESCLMVVNFIKKHISLVGSSCYYQYS